MLVVVVVEMVLELPNLDCFVVAAVLMFCGIVLSMHPPARLLFVPLIMVQMHKMCTKFI